MVNCNRPYLKGALGEGANMYHYDAFISYNHNERDIKITKNLQNRLEHYRLPKGTETSSGKDRIERVFLDSGELEVAGDLSKVLQDALDNADNLIVICSPESKASIWVRREIEYFLQSHSINKVHTVLTEGEPIDVLPDILLREEYTDEDGTVKSRAREPLSCDYRMPLNKANKQELPRLVAAILGCRYDDLVQRQRQYRMRRQITALAAAAVFLTSATGYLVWSNKQIKENLNNTLREESINLAIQSEQDLSRGDRVNAIRSAIEALPSEGNDRPVVPRAVKALSDALNIYRTKSAENWKAVRQYESKGEDVLKIRSVKAGDRVFMADIFTSGELSIWDAESGAELMADYTAGLESIKNIEFTEDGKLVALSRSSVYLLDPAEEKEIFRTEFGRDEFPNGEWGNISVDCDELAVTDDSLWIYEGHTDIDSEYEAQTFYELQKIDLRTGDIAERHSINDRPLFIRVSDDGRYLSYVESTAYMDEHFVFHEGPDRLMIADTKDAAGFENAKMIEKACITDVCFDSNNRIIVCGFDERPSEDDLSQYSHIDFVGNDHRNLFSISKDREIRMSSLDAVTGQELWENKYQITGSGTPGIMLRQDGESGWDIICAMWNTIFMTDRDGKDLKRLELPGCIESFFNRDSLVRATTFNGEMCAYDTENGQLHITYNLLNGPVRGSFCRDNEDFFMVTSDMSGMGQSETVTQYRVIGADPAWEPYGYSDKYAEDDVAAYFVTAEHTADGKIVEIREDERRSRETNNTRVLVRNSDDGKIVSDFALQTFALDGSGYYENCYLKYSGISTDGKKIYFMDDVGYDSLKVLTADLDGKKEKLTDVKLDDEGEENIYHIIQSDYSSVLKIGDYHIADDKIWCMARRSDSDTDLEAESIEPIDTLLAVGIDPETGEVEKHEITLLGESEKTRIQGKINGECRRLLCLETADDENGRLKMVCYDFDGNIVWENDAIPQTITGMLLADDGSAVIFEETQNNAKAHFYSSKDGSEEASPVLEGVSTQHHEEISFTRLSEKENLLTAGNDAFILDAETFEPLSVIAESYITYDPVNKIFMLGDARGKETGHVPYRSLDDMIKEARAVIE